jgi:hypothetical protein
MGQATWYLQSTIIQCPDYSITLDQSRYAALVVQRYSTIPDSDIDQKTRDRYATPIPTSAKFSKIHGSATYSDVMKIQKEYGFECANEIGSLIYLMNTLVRLNYAITKLARFMQYPGRYHFKLLRHLLRHLQCHRHKGAIKLYSNTTQSSWCRYMTTTGNEVHANSPIICFTDSSFQDCPDTARSTGGYLIFMQGTAIDAKSTMPTLASQSTCEAEEYCTCALATMACYSVRKIYNEFYGLDPDQQFHYSNRQRLAISN